MIMNELYGKNRRDLVYLAGLLDNPQAYDKILVPLSQGPKSAGDTKLENRASVNQLVKQSTTLTENLILEPEVIVDVHDKHISKIEINIKSLVLN